MTYHRSISQNLSPSPSMAKLHCKLSRIVSRHDQLKLSFIHLKSQIKSGLLEAEDVFCSLAVPLMKLVGLKNAEMAEEGRSSIITNISVHAQGTCEDRNRIDTHKSLSTGERENAIRSFEEDYTDSALTIGKEIIQKQKLQLTQLFQVLKQVEICINSSQKSMFQTIDYHKESFQTVMQKAANCASIIQQLSHDDRAHPITLKILKAIYEHVCELFISIEGGVDDLVMKLTEQMGKPMNEYVKSFKAEMTSGTCHRLLVSLEDMKQVERGRRVELSQARKKARAAEERTLQALSKLRASEERVKKMKQIIERQESSSFYPKHKLVTPNNEQSKDDKFLWDLLKMKQTCKQPESRFGAQETSSSQQKSTVVKPPITTMTTRSTTTKSKLLPLGVLVTARQASSRRHFDY